MHKAKIGIGVGGSPSRGGSHESIGIRFSGIPIGEGNRSSRREGERDVPLQIIWRLDRSRSVARQRELRAEGVAKGVEPLVEDRVASSIDSSDGESERGSRSMHVEVRRGRIRNGEGCRELCRSGR